MTYPVKLNPLNPLQREISDRILDVVNLSNELTRSDLQSLVDVLTVAIINQVLMTKS